MESTPIKKGIIYCRVSSSEQVENTSLESQERNCKEYAKRENIEVLQIFIERGESAKTANRTEFIKALNFCDNKKNNVTHFIVYKLDRFARSKEDHVITQMLLKKRTVLLRSVTEFIDETPMGKMMEGILSTFAQFDNDVRTERCTGGMVEKVKQGVWVWSAPIGFYRPLSGSNIAPEASTMLYIKIIFEEYAKGTYTFKSLAKHMSNRGMLTRQGKKPTMQLMEKILKNPLYSGRIKAFGLDIKGDFESIIREELFAQCQKGYKK